MQGHCPALPLVADLDLEAENVAELPLKRFKIGVNHLRAAPNNGSIASGAGLGPHLFAPSPFLRLPDGISPAMISRVRASGSLAVAIARACPMLISPFNSDCRTNSGSSNNLSRLATWLRDLWTIRPTSSCV